MNEKPSANTNGNGAGNSDGKQERNTRTVEVRVWTSNLGALSITPLLTDEDRMAVLDADGEYNEELESSIQEGALWTELYFVADNDVCLKVFDGGECILEQDSLPNLDPSCLATDAKALQAHGEVTADIQDVYDQYDETDLALYQSVVRAAAPDDADFNAGTVGEFWKKMQNGDFADPKEGGFLMELIKHFGNRLGRRSGRAPAFLDSVGDKGKCTVTFEIEIPENEPFDIDKLHFFRTEDFWADVDAHETIRDKMVSMDTSLELLEYDGKIYCREADVEDFYGCGIPGWRFCDTLLVHADLKEFAPDELLCEDNTAQVSFEGAKIFSFNQGVFKNMLNLTNYAASTKLLPKPVLNGVLLSFKDGRLSAVATDRRCLALAEQELAIPETDEADLVVPLKTVKKLLGTLGNEGEVRISVTSTHAAFEYGSHNMTTKLLEGGYPDVRKIIPKATGNGVTLERETFLSMLRRITRQMCGDSDDIDLSDFTAKLSLTASQLDILVTDLDDGEAHECMDIKYSGENVTTAFCLKYLVDPLEHLTSDEISLELLGSTSPSVIRSSSGLVYVFMPIRPS